jgi:hypothetical protein
VAQDTSLECVSVCVCVSDSSVQCVIGELIGVSRHWCYLPSAIHLALVPLPRSHSVCACACVCVCDGCGGDGSKGIKNFSIRGTKYSLPLPVQGRNKDDVVLREDQLAMSRHRQRRDKVVLDDDGFQTLVPRDERKGRTNFSNQDVIGMGYAGGGKNNPNARKRH